MSKGEIVGRIVTRPMKGDLAKVVNALDNLERRGDLVERPRPGQVRQLRNGKILVNVRYIDRTPVRDRHRADLLRVIKVGVGGFAAAGVGGVVFRLLTGDLLLVALGTLFLFVAVVTGLLVAFNGGGVSGLLPGGGHHCPGCPDH